MKKRIRKILLVLAIFTCVLWISGCSTAGNIMTELQINDDLSGVRTICIDVERAAVQSRFQGGVDELNTLIDERCPQYMDWELEERKGGYLYTFRIEFENWNEYTTKINAILGYKADPILLTYDDMWTKGFKMQENYSSIELLNWLKSALLNTGKVEEEYKDKMFQNARTSLTMNGAVYETEAEIQVDNVTSCKPQKIDVLTTFKDWGCYDRKIIIYISAKVMSEIKDDIETFIEKRVPKDADITWQIEENVYKIIISKENMNEKQVTDFMCQTLGNNGNKIELEEYDKKPGVFQFLKRWNETVNVSEFVPSIDRILEIGYYIKNDSIYEVRDIKDGSKEMNGPETEDYPGYVCAFNSAGLEEQYSVYFGKAYFVKQVDITTDLSSDNIARKIIITIDKLPDAAECEVILNRINQRIADDTTVQEQESNGTWTIEIDQSGNADDIDAGSKEIFGSGTTILKKKTDEYLKRVVKMEYEERFDYSEFFTEITGDYTMNYRLIRPSSSYEKTIQEVKEVDGSSVSYTLKTSKPLFISYLIGIIVILVILIGLITNKEIIKEIATWRIRRRKMKKNEEENIKG